eukprot:1723123-Pleurochrysis_carterae.AAC.1
MHGRRSSSSRSLSAPMRPPRRSSSRHTARCGTHTHNGRTHVLTRARAFRCRGDLTRPRAHTPIRACAPMRRRTRARADVCSRPISYNILFSYRSRLREE